MQSQNDNEKIMKKALTLFTIPKPFIGHINVIQRNAIKSWLQLRPKCEIMLFGDDLGVNEAAKEFDLISIPEIVKNEYNTPMLNSVFDLAQKKSSNEIMVFVNADILLSQDLISVVENIYIRKFLVSGRRYDVDLRREMSFEDKTEYSKLEIKVKNEGILHGYSGKDYFIFRKNTVKMLPFAVGRPGWDDWLLYHMREQCIPIINSTHSITAIHQNHDYSHSKYGEDKRVSGPEWVLNNKTIGSFTNIIGLRDADWVIEEGILSRPKGILRLSNMLSYSYLWRLLLAVKRRMSIRYSRMRSLRK